MQGKKNEYHRLLWACALSVAGGSACLAAAPTSVPGPADIGQTQKHLEEETTPPPAGRPEIEVAPEPLVEEAPPGAEQIKIKLRKVTIDGVTAYTPEALRAYYAPYLDKTISLKTVYEIAASMTRRYREDGYVLTRVLVPAQEIEHGRIRLQAVEGYVADVHIPEGQDNRIMRELIERIKAMRPLHEPTLERMLLTLDDVPGIQMKTSLLPMTDKDAEPGAVLMQMEVVRTPVGGQASFGNDGSRYVGPWQGTAAAWFSDQLLPFDQLSVKLLTTTHAQEMHYGEIQYHAPLNAYGTSAGVIVSGANSTPGHTLAPLQIVSESSTLRGEVIQNFIHSRAMTLNVTAGLEIKDITTDALQAELYHDRLTVATGGLQISDGDAWAGINSLNANLRQGIDALGARPTGSADLSRADGHSSFTLVNGTASRLQTISGPWQVNLAATGQYAWQPLLASEQFGFGGSAFGRAYDPSAITGDDGLAASVELRYSAFRLDDYRLNLMPFTYYDIGKVWNISAGGEPASAASAGGGVVLRSDYGPQLTLTGAEPLTRPQADPQTGNGKSPRWLADLSYQF